AAGDRRRAVPDRGGVRRRGDCGGAASARRRGVPGSMGDRRVAFLRSARRRDPGPRGAGRVVRLDRPPPGSARPRLDGARDRRTPPRRRGSLRQGDRRPPRHLPPHCLQPRHRHPDQAGRTQPHRGGDGRPRGGSPPL
ncbi:MAG: hypothetical protein AVDCRST_MAG59-1041, partial [uncultured Thermomicrobiales bacterium]